MIQSKPHSLWFPPLQRCHCCYDPLHGTCRNKDHRAGRWICSCQAPEEGGVGSHALWQQSCSWQSWRSSGDGWCWRCSTLWVFLMPPNSTFKNCKRGTRNIITQMCDYRKRVYFLLGGATHTPWSGTRWWKAMGHVIHEQWVPRLRALTLKPANTGAVKQNKSVGLI